MFFNSRLKVKTFNRRNERFKKRLIPLTLVLIILIGCIYQQLCIHFTASGLGRMGKLINVDGTNMHLYEAGKGEIPLVFTSAIGSSVPYIDLFPIHHYLSNDHKVMLYDRPGYGWSDITSKSRDIDTICEEIHTLLHYNDNPDDEDETLQPFIYIAQGSGSIEAIRYAQLYPEDVLGIVFIEGMSPSFGADFNNIMIIESFITNGLRNTGFLRFIKNSSYVNTIVNNNPELSPELRKINKGIALDYAWNRNVISEQLKLPNNAEKVLLDMPEDKLGDLPIRVITSEANIYTNWSSCQRSLLSLSTDSRQVFIENSTSVINASDVPTILTTIESFISHVEDLKED